MNKVVTKSYNKVDYLIINTGYTSRILGADLAKVFLDNSCEYAYDPLFGGKLVDENGNEPPTTRKEILDLKKCVYVKDSLWGKTTDTKEFKMDEILGPSNSSDTSGIFGIAPICEVQEAHSLIDMAFKDKAEQYGGPLDGYIVFKDTNLTDAFRIVDFLMQVDYCAFFKISSMHNVDLREVAGQTLLWLQFDCESG